MMPMMLLFTMLPQTVLCLVFAPIRVRPFKPFTARFTDTLQDINDKETQLKAVLFAPVPMINEKRPILDQIANTVNNNLEPRESSIEQYVNGKSGEIVAKEEPEFGLGLNRTGKHEFDPIYRRKGESTFHRLYDSMEDTTTLKMVSRTPNPTEPFSTNNEEPLAKGINKIENKMISTELRFPGVFIDSRRMYSMHVLDPETGKYKVQFVDTIYHPLSHKLYLSKYKLNDFKLSKIGKILYDTYKLNGLPQDLRNKNYYGNAKEVQGKRNLQLKYKYVYPNKEKISPKRAVPIESAVFD